MLLRKIRIDRWPEDASEMTCIDDIPADPITRDMNAASNTFSVWDFETDELIDGVLAIVLNSNCTKIDTIDVVYLDKEDVVKEMLELNNDMPGITSYKKFENKHFDIINMNHKALGKVASIIIKSIEKENYETFHRDDLLDACVDRIKNGDLNLSDLNSKLQSQIKSRTS